MARWSLMRGLATLPARAARFLREVRSELRKVIWPDRRETAIYTAVVLASVVVVGLAIWAVDALVSAAFAWILFR